MAAPRTVPATPEVNIPPEVEFLAERLKALWIPLTKRAKDTEAVVIKTPEDAKKVLIITKKEDFTRLGLTASNGETQRKKEQGKYELQAAWILDYIVFNYIDEFKNIFKTGGDPAKVKNIPTEVYNKFDKDGIFALEKYFDPYGAPHIYENTEVSFDLYIKLRLYVEFMEKLHDYSDKALKAFQADPKVGITPFGRSCLRIFFLNNHCEDDKTILRKEDTATWMFMKWLTLNKRLPGTKVHLAEYKHKAEAEEKYKEYLQKNFACTPEDVFVSMEDKQNKEAAAAEAIQSASVTACSATFYSVVGSPKSKKEEENKTSEAAVELSTIPTPSF